MQHGVYVHPLWLFRKNHGGEWGFTVGDTPNDDLPTLLRMTCQQLSTLIYQLLSQSTMFPTGSSLYDAVANCYGNGLKALKAILQRSHPAFVDEPATLVTTYPKQRTSLFWSARWKRKTFCRCVLLCRGSPRNLTTLASWISSSIIWSTAPLHSVLLEMKDDSAPYYTSIKETNYLKRSTRS